MVVAVGGIDDRGKEKMLQLIRGLKDAGIRIKPKDLRDSEKFL